MELVHFLFYMALILYVGALTCYCVSLFSENKVWIRAYISLFLIGFLFHTISLLMQSINIFNLPLRNLLYALNLFCWTLAAFALFLHTRARMRLFAAALLGMIAFFGAMLFIIPEASKDVIPSFNGFWFTTHIFFTFAGYAAFVIALLSAVGYILLDKKLKNKSSGILFDQLPSLATLEMIDYRAIRGGVLLMGLGIVFGFMWAWWSNRAFPLTHPKILLSVITVLIYGVVVLLKQKGIWSGKKLAYLSIISFCILFMCFLHLVAAGHSFF